MTTESNTDRARALAKEAEAAFNERNLGVADAKFSSSIRQAIELLADEVDALRGKHPTPRD